MTDGVFSDRIALVTGAGSGIGRGIAERLSREGAHVVLHGRTQSKLDETASLLSGPKTVIEGDVSSADDNVRTAQRVADELDRLDILVNNAAHYFRASIEELAWDDFRQMYDVNLFGLTDLAKRMLPLLRKSKPSGCVINISSTAALGASANSLAYASSKQAVIYATGTMAAEWAPEVRVNCVAPGFVDTPIHRQRGMTDEQVREFLDSVGEKHPMGRVGKPEDIAGAVAYLASPDAQWITGSTLVVDGGYQVG
ncbi:MAG: glucose 1-dehydrogenase [candidate division Zixibacteria bacterium]|nr:glucose 1-dehydrogenase [candidate division Zixibacteria bacterium]